jgi:hypothetical protein
VDQRTISPGSSEFWRNCSVSGSRGSEGIGGAGPIKPARSPRGNANAA